MNLYTENFGLCIKVNKKVYVSRVIVISVMTKHDISSMSLEKSTGCHGKYRFDV